MTDTISLSAHAVQIQQAILDALEADPFLASALGDPIRVHDALPEDPIYPYMTFGAVRSEDTSADETPQSTHQINLHLWSRYAGRAEVLSLMERIESAVHAVESFTVVPIYLDVFRAPDGRTRQGLLRLSITFTP